MASLLISGGRALEGEIEIQGSKNAVLPLMAAAMLLPGVTRLSGCPQISDVEAMTELLMQCGAKVFYEGRTLCIDALEIEPVQLSAEHMRKTRAGVLLLGALLGRCGSCEMAYPGGCVIGSRPVNLHLKAFRELGYQVKEDEWITCEGNGKPGKQIVLDFPSVGATQNILLVSAGIAGETRLVGAACEPEVTELCRFLQLAGVQIFGIGTKNLRIVGNPALRPIEYAVPSDRIVAGTYLTAVLAAGGEVFLKNAFAEEQEALLMVLRRAGAEVIEDRVGMLVKGRRRLNAFGSLSTAPYPGFPTDMQSQMLALACVCDGVTRLEETVFEARFATAEQLRQMGAQIEVEQNQAVIYGTECLQGAKVEAADLRGGAALVIAGLVAVGQTRVAGYHYLQRGYEDIVRDLKSLGAEINLY